MPFPRWAVVRSFSSWHTRKRPKRHSDSQLSSCLLCPRWSGSCLSYRITVPPTNPCLSNLFAGSIPTSSIYFLHLLLFFSSGVNDFQESFSWNFCVFTLHRILIQLFVAEDSQICISSLAFPAEPNRHFQSFLGFLTLVSHSTSCNLAHFFLSFYFLSKSAPPTIFPISPPHGGCFMSILPHLYPQPEHCGWHTAQGVLTKWMEGRKEGKKDRGSK